MWRVRICGRPSDVLIARLLDELSDAIFCVSRAMIKGCGEVYITWFKGQVAGGDILLEEGQIAPYRISPTKALRQ